MDFPYLVLNGLPLLFSIPSISIPPTSMQVISKMRKTLWQRGRLDELMDTLRLHKKNGAYKPIRKFP